MDNKCINELYNKTVDTIISGIDSEYIDKVKDGYKKYLFNVYDDYYDINNPVESAKLVASDIEDIIIDWENESPFNKMSYFVEDKAMDEIRKLSSDAYKLASDKLNGIDTNISKEEANEKIKNIEKLSDEVEFFNDFAAQEEISEAVLDYQYASGINSDVMSLRLGHEYGQRLNMNR